MFDTMFNKRGSRQDLLIADRMCADGVLSGRLPALDSGKRHPPPTNTSTDGWYGRSASERNSWGHVSAILRRAQDMHHPYPIRHKGGQAWLLRYGHQDFCLSNFDSNTPSAHTCEPLGPCCWATQQQSYGDAPSPGGRRAGLVG